MTSPSAFTNGLDPAPRSRRVFAFHRPETLATWVHESDTLRSRLREPFPTGIFYAQGVKANVLFFDKKPARERPWTERLWTSRLLVEYSGSVQ